MLKFFRETRQSLLSEGKLSKYLLYAIGEILLVMIGILLALQVNNWNQDLKDIRKEKLILKELNKEFKLNKEQLDTVLYHHNRIAEGLKNVTDIMPITFEDISLDSLTTDLWKTFKCYTFNPSNGTTNALINSGSIELIRNEELRHLLISWNDLIFDYQEEEIIQQQFGYDYYNPYFLEYFNWDLDFSDPRNDLKMLTTLKFENLLKEQQSNNDNILKGVELGRVQAALEKIIELTES